MIKRMAWTIPALAVGLTCASHAAELPRRVTTQVDNSNRVTLTGNVRPEATVANDRGAVADSMPLDHMQLLLQRSPEQEAALASAIDALHDPQSKTYHQWLTAEQFGAQYGVAQSDIAAVTTWLTSRGFKVGGVHVNAMTIDFSGTAGNVRNAFHTEIHQLAVKGAKHIANMSDPQIPAALAPVVKGVVSLNDFRPQTMVKRAQKNAKFLRQDAATGGSSTVVAPTDLATIYNFKPVFTAGNTGQGQTIAVIEDTDVYSAQDWTTFRNRLGLSGYTAGSLVQLNPPQVSGQRIVGGNNCIDPGITGNAIEAEVDAEWASAAAPSAKIVVAACADGDTTFGGLYALQNLIDSKTPPQIISMSYGECEAALGAAGNAAYSAAYQQAVTEGISVFVSSGDDGAASCDAGQNGAYNGISVNGFASTPYNVAVGGTDFSDYSANTTSTYWSGGAALSYIPEIPWNTSCAGSVFLNYVSASIAYGASGYCNTIGALQYAMDTTVAGSGGPSNCATGTPTFDNSSGLITALGSCQGTAKPSWQSGVVGLPSDGVRDIPDVSMFASNYFWGHAYVECYSDVANGGHACTGTPDDWTLLGGTSISAPIMAGVQALINNKTGSKQGNPNYVYYKLAATEYGSGGSASCNSSNGASVGSSCVFYDVTQGDITVNCFGFDCYGYTGTTSGFRYGVLSTSSSTNSPAFQAKTGWDFATGIGTVNVANLVNGWSSQ